MVEDGARVKPFAGCRPPRGTKVTAADKAPGALWTRARLCCS